MTDKNQPTDPEFPAHEPLNNPVDNAEGTTTPASGSQSFPAAGEALDQGVEPSEAPEASAVSAPAVESRAARRSAAGESRRSVSRRSGRNSEKNPGKKSGRPAAQAGIQGRGSSSRPLARLVWGTISGVGIAGATAAVVFAGSLPVAGDLAAGTTFEVPAAQLPAGQSMAVCPAPAQLLTGSADNTDPQFAPGSSDARTAVSALVGADPNGSMPASRLAPLSTDPLASLASISQENIVPPPEGVQPPQAANFARLSERSVDGVSVLRVDPVADQRTPSAAVQTYRAGNGDLRGLAAASCQAPANDGWLVGASTEVGRTAILYLTNPSSTPATVDLDLYGDSGMIQSAGARGILVPAGTTKSIVLAGLASGQKELSVRFRSSGGPVSATIQQSVLRGLTAGGVDYLTPLAVPATRQVITGVQTMAPELAGQISGQDGYQDAQTALQVVVPSPGDSVVEVKVYGPSGQVSLPDGGVFTAKGASTSELLLNGLPEDVYTVDITADAPVTAAVRSVRGSNTGDPVDLASANAAGRLAGNQLIVLPEGNISKLAFGLPAGKAELSLVPIGTDGKAQEEKTVSVNGGTTVVVNPEELAGGSVAGFILTGVTGDPVYGAQVLRDGDRIAVVDVPRSIASQQSVPVGLSY
ncbi:DUF5719 family protein [Acaricomes phytoseiuli]|uniref:DUF5719 family protein n=1 Tax=Acaricomes phytoseiuli TaxID=291968 RepID=UPI002222A9A7|nr:DUF5719 family protein [Acaricomes phytoseiuli]MCW1249872.1 DUF5719 family protein [Acaricomes phytoseiuli]